MKPLLVLAAILACASPGAWAQQPAANAHARLIIGLEGVKHNAGGELLIQNGSMQFKAGKTDATVPISSIEDIFVGTETTQAGGKTGRAVKTAAIAAPFGSGKALTLLLRTKVDILTAVYRGANGEMHAAILALPKGQAEATRSQLVAAGAHVSAPPQAKEKP